MRIALVSQEYPPETAHGGIGTQTYLKAHGLAARAHEVYVISHSVDDRKHVYRDGGVQVIRIPNRDGQFEIRADPVRRLSYSTEVARAVDELHAEADLDLVDFPEYGAEGYVYLLNRTPWNRVPAVVHLHGPSVMLARTVGWPQPDSEEFRQAAFMESTCVRLADAVLSSSACSADWIARTSGIDRSTVTILHSGVDTTHFRPAAGDPPDRPTVVFVGKIERNKGVDVLLDAACTLAKEIPDLRLCLAGRGNDRLTSELRARAERHPGLLEMPGFVTHAELPALLSGAHVFAAPSAYEGGPGFVYLEAMACGLPVVACAGSGAAEVVHHEENGLLVEPDDRAGLAAALRRLLAQPDDAAEMGRRGRRYVEQEADTRVCADRLEAYYASVIRSAQVAA